MHLISYARFLNRGVTLGLVNPRLVGCPEIQKPGISEVFDSVVDDKLSQITCSACLIEFDDGFQFW